MTVNDYVAMMRHAKSRLEGKWVNAAVATLIYVAINAVASCTYIGSLILIGPLSFGYVLYLMCLGDTGRSDFNILFSGFNRFAETLVAGLLMTLAVGLGCMLLIVPGIILSCGFAMTYFIMSDDRNISGIDALQQSWNMMKGHKMEFFCLQLRFIGWMLLCVITCGILVFWVRPYMTLTYLNFYRQLRHGAF